MNEGAFPASDSGDAPVPSESVPESADPQPEAGVPEGQAVPDVGAPADEPVKPKKPVGYYRTGKFRPGLKMRAAIMEVAARQAQGWPSGYAEVAARHGVKEKSLSRLMVRYKRGEIEMGDKQAIEEKVQIKKEIVLQAELFRRQALVTEYMKHLDDVLAARLKKVKAEFRDGNDMAFQQLGLPSILEQMSKAGGFSVKMEKGMIEILEQLQGMHDRRKELLQPPQPVKGTVIEPRQTGAAQELSVTAEQAKIHELLTSEA